MLTIEGFRRFIYLGLMPLALGCRSRLLFTAGELCLFVLWFVVGVGGGCCLYLVVPWYLFN